MAINLAGANDYFADGNHPRASVWQGFANSPDLQKAAIAQAKRVWVRMLKRDLEDPTDPTDATEFPRDDFTIYEQALYELENGIIADGSLATSKFIAGRTKPDEARERSVQAIAPEAMRWQFRGQRLIIRRG
jgi:hypothetical protein